MDRLELGLACACIASILFDLGVAGIAWAAPEHSTSHAGAAGLAAALGALVLIAAAPYLIRRETAAQSALLPLSAGCAFACTGISSKLIADFLSSSTWIPVLAWFAFTVTLALIGLLSEMSALQRRPATRVVPWCSSPR